MSEAKVASSRSAWERGMPTAVARSAAIMTLPFRDFLRTLVVEEEETWSITDLLTNRVASGDDSKLRLLLLMVLRMMVAVVVFVTNDRAGHTRIATRRKTM